MTSEKYTPLCVCLRDFVDTTVVRMVRNGGA